MYVGTQVAARNDSDFEQWAQLGVMNVCSDPPGNPADWTIDDLKRHREKVNSYGIELDMVQIPLSSTPLDRSQSPNIMLGKSPERDREIDSIQNIIRMCGEVGIPAVKYNMNIIGIPRSEREEGRGGSSNSTFRWSKMNQDDPPTIAGVVGVEDNWERIDYFLSRAVPAAESAKVRLACHPHDPYTPDGYMGVTRVLGTIDGMKKFVQMHESEYHGLNFCQGTVTEMLDDPGKEIADVIRWFGSRNKILMFTSATFAVTNSTSWKRFQTRARSISRRSSRSTKRLDTSTCLCLTTFLLSVVTMLRELRLRSATGTSRRFFRESASHASSRG